MHETENLFTIGLGRGYAKMFASQELEFSLNDYPEASPSPSPGISKPDKQDITSSE